MSEAGRFALACFLIFFMLVSCNTKNSFFKIIIFALKYPCVYHHVYDSISPAQIIYESLM